MICQAKMEGKKCKYSNKNKRIHYPLMFIFQKLLMESKAFGKKPFAYTDNVMKIAPHRGKTDNAQSGSC
jgi:hypothetical protein